MNKWTNDQQMAIDNRNSTLLVSAAAGSGKTAVLVERIIKRVTTEKIAINKFLIVTYTNMAAKEMKEKILRAIADEVIKNPSDLFLREQLSLVHKAQIATVHSFCFNLIRENFTNLNISPDFKVLSELDAKTLKKDCMEDVLFDFFKDMPDDFCVLVDILGENNMESQMLKIHSFIQSNASPKKFLKDNLENYENACKNGFNTTIWYQIICEKALNALNDCVNFSDEACKLCSFDDVLNDKNAGILANENQIIKDISNALINNDWDTAYNHLQNMTFPTWKACTKSLNKEICNNAKNLRDAYKNSLGKIADYIYLPLAEINLNNEKLTKAIRAINDILFHFDYVYSKEKQRKNSLDFNDAEHKAIELLSKNEEFEKSDVAYELSKKFTEIMVDEYQDTNEIQDTIFKLLSKDETNIFMVGDVKQSIYKFRLADPTIFLEKYINFDTPEECPTSKFKKITLSKNFRSRKEVLDATNFIFENIMSQKSGGIDYDDNQKLYLGSDYPDYEHSMAEFCLIDYNEFNTGEKQLEVEAQVLASKIANLIETQHQIFDKDLGHMRELNYSDIVILLRSTSEKAYFYKTALENIGINVDFKEGSEKLFGTPEVSNLISLFRIIDNYLLEVELVSIMLSPIFGFSVDEISSIRLDNREISLFDNVLQNSSEKCKNLILSLDDIKKYSENNSVFKTIWYVIYKFDLLAKYALMPYGSIRRNNILRFLDFVNTLDSNYSVYNFVNFLDRIDNSKTTLPAEQKSGHCVKIMTMHASKGLEFPVVFLADMAKQFNKRDLIDNITLHNKLGIGLKFIDDENIVSYSSLMQKAIKMETVDELTAEEMRVLYVAMTRAKEKLFIMCTLKNAPQTFEKWLIDTDPLQCKSVSSWFGMNIAKLPSAKIFYEKFNIIENVKINVNLPNIFTCNYINSYDTNDFVPETEQVLKNFEILDFEYKYQNETKIPSKLTATDAKNQETIQKYHKKPKFISNSKLTATERGIAHHIVMQFIDFYNCQTLDDIKKDIKRLYDNNFISKSQYECINPSKIAGFIHSNIGQRLLKSSNVMREFKFSILADAKKYYNVETDDKVLLQGVIDCMFIENDKIIMVDYKTDSITPENIEEVTLEHSIQLEIYAKALEEIYNLPVTERYFYYFKNESVVNLADYIK